MGNQPSKPPSRSTTQHERDERQQRHDKEREREKQEREWERDREREKEREKEREREKRVNRRISFQALSHGKATAADPSASTESAHAKTILQPPAQKPNLHQHLHTTHSSSPEQNERSPPSAGSSNSPVVIREEQKELEHRPDGQNPLSQVPAATAEPSIPMDVPGSTSIRTARESRKESIASQSTPPALTPHYTPMSGLQRPPRLPLAIADEIRAPESPTLVPVETLNEEVSIFDDDEADLPRKSSMVSSATVDEEDVAHELEPYAVDTGGVSLVPTRIDWRGGGEKVYVTGTFTNWDKKFRLHERYGLLPMFLCSQVLCYAGSYHLHRLCTDNPAVFKPGYRSVSPGTISLFWRNVDYTLLF